MSRTLCVFVCLLIGLFESGRAEEAKPDGAGEALKAAAAFHLPPEFTVQLFAADPQLVNPIALCLDEQGRVFVAEEHRFNEGTEENRTRPYLLEDDLQITTLEDRVAMFKKWEHKFEGRLSFLTKKSDLVRRLVDQNGDGRADQATIFADGFNNMLDGLGSGLIAREGQLWYACIPNLWLLEDQDGDGHADARSSLLRGFGVNAAFLGHDLHGLVWGPDGKLYFSVGDRGAHVVTKEGTTISNPRNGAVFRCQPDGTEMEMIHRGLRNPQELAFDQYGNLFADDNNCDKGDHSRLVYVVPGGDSGWNMAFQTIPEPYLTGPWHAEAMWHLEHALQPAYIVPPVGKLGAGPSGFVFSSGTSLPPRFRDHFFYCNFTGNGGIESFAVQPQGAGFTIVDHQDFCKPVQASDVDFGYDGKMYIAVYPASPWDRTTSGGRIYSIFDASRLKHPIVTETERRFRNGFTGVPMGELAELLHHEDMRIRQRAQFALAAQGADAMESLANLAAEDTNRLTRLHAIWGLGQIGRDTPAALQIVLGLLSDEDPEIRAQAARVLGDARYRPASEQIVPLLRDEVPRVRFFAALALGSLQFGPAVGPIFDMLHTNDDQDRFLRHAGVVALERIGDPQQVQQRAGDKSNAVRMAVALVQRRWSDPRISQFLDDAELDIVVEAARAINDQPLLGRLEVAPAARSEPLIVAKHMPTGRAKLAQLAERYRHATDARVAPLLRRVINANFQIGARANAAAVVGIATSTTLPPAIRAEAIAALSEWQTPSNRDRVTGYWRPIPARDGTVVRDVVQQAASQLLATTDGPLQTQVTKLLTKLDVETNDRAFAAWVGDPQRAESSRLAALRLLAHREFASLPEVVEQSLESNSAALRSEARDLLAAIDPPRAATLLAALLDQPEADVSEQQRALATLGRMQTPSAAMTLDVWADRLRKGQVPLALQLDLIEVFATSSTASRAAALRAFAATADESDPLAPYRLALAGGDAQAGGELFAGHVAAQCIRCHTVGNRGGTAGPNLSHVADPKRHSDRRFLLESIVLPNAKIAPGFGTVTLVLDTGQLVAGTIQAEDAEFLTLVTPQQETIRIPRGTIDEQTATTSAMPSMAKVLTQRELRDLIEYLATLR